MSKQNPGLLFLLGLTIGAVAGVLLAPDEGKKTLKRLRKKVDHLSDEVSTLYDAGVPELKEKFTTLTSSLDLSKEGLSGQYQHVHDSVRSIVVEGKKKIKEIKDDVMNKLEKVQNEIDEKKDDVKNRIARKQGADI